MSKNINKIEHFDLSFFPNTITGSYDPKVKPSSPSSASGEEGSTSSGTSSSSTTARATIISSDGSILSSPSPPEIPKITENFTLRMSKLPADNFGNIVPVVTVNPSTNDVTPSVFYDSMDETGTYNKNTFLKGLNDALAECIKQEDTCYAVVIKDPTDPRVPESSFGKAYKFELAQKPPPNNKNDSESLYCNPLYFTYLKNRTKSGYSNIMPNAINCNFDSGPVKYEGSSGNNNNDLKNNTKPPPPKSYKYKDMGVEVKSDPFPWLLVIGIIILILIIGGGIYYYYNFGPGAPIIPVKKIVKKVVKKVVKGGLLTSKFIKKSGGYFFFI